MRIDVSADLATEAQRDADLAVAPLEERYERQVERLLRRFTRLAIGAFLDAQVIRVIGAAGDGVTDDTAAIQAALNAAASEQPQWRVPLPADLLDQAAAQAALESDSTMHRDAVARTAGEAAAAKLGVDFATRNEILNGVIAAQGGMKIVTAPQDLVGTLMDSLQHSYDTGASIPHAASALRAAGYTHSQGYAKRIARTETLGAVNDASLGLVRLATNIKYKRWMATHDGRTRLTHSIADGQVVPLSDPFSVGGAPLDYPGDPSGPGDEVVNCRCTLGYQDTLSINTIAGGGRMAAVDTTTTDEATTGAAWSGVIAQEGVDTGDGRRIEPGALKFRALPLTLMGQKTTPDFGGHAEAQVAGRIDTITREGENMMGEGVFDSGEWGADIERLVREKMLNGISVDLAVNEAEYIPDPDIEDPLEALWMGTLNILDGTILGATVVPFPAFENASIAIVAGGAMRLHSRRRELVGEHGLHDDGKDSVVVSFFMPFTPAINDPSRDPDIDAMISEVEQVVRGYPMLSSQLTIGAHGSKGIAALHTFHTQATP